MTGTLHVCLCRFVIIFRSFLLRMINVLDKICRENQNTYFVFNNFFFKRKLFRLWDNVEKCDRAGQVTDNNVIRRVYFACCVPKATNAHSEYVILIAFPRHQLLRERAPNFTFVLTLLSRSQWPCGLRPLACWDCGFESHRGHGCLSVVSVVCCQVEVSATRWSLVQRSPTDCGASLCVI